MTMDWLTALATLRDAGIPAVLISVTEAKGYTPREAGVKMVVSADKQFGTIGGGALEFEAIAAARALLANAETSAQKKDYPLGPKLAQCCGGHVSVLLEPFVPPGFSIYLFGAGHVGREVVKVLDGLPLRVKWVDERADEFPDTIPANCEKIVTARPVAKMKELSNKACAVVMTHDHALDYELVKAALQNVHFAYLGLIGSKTKAVRFNKRLQDEGLDTSRLTCPIGIPGIMGKHPREIAISLAAELLALGITCVNVEEEDVHQDNHALR